MALDKTYALNLQELAQIAYGRARELADEHAGRAWVYRDARTSTRFAQALREQDYARLLWRRQAAVRGLLD